ncbi:MAG: SRPBCC family protein [Acidimicrobiales bacterium]
MTIEALSTKSVRAAFRRGGFVAGGLALAGGAAIAAYPLWRTWCLTWGATGEEVTRTLPGDDLLVEPDLVSTRAIWVNAPADAVWPWLAQMGAGRGGVYTYDWIENILGLGIHSVDVVLPEFQDIKLGDAQRLGTNGPVLRVAVVDLERALVFRSDDGKWVWAFCLVGAGARTRLISRNRIATRNVSWPTRALYRYVMEPGSLVMERKMLIGIRERSERMAQGLVGEAIRRTKVAPNASDSTVNTTPTVALREGRQ